MCRESGLLLLASALSSSLALPPSRGGVMITGCFGVTASLRGACGDRRVVVWGRCGLRVSSGESAGTESEVAVDLLTVPYRTQQHSKHEYGGGTH